MVNDEDARARVTRGAALLDAIRPNWFNRINTGTLTLDSPCGCVIAQTMSVQYKVGCHRLGIQWSSGDCSDDLETQAQRLGFFQSHSASFRDLQDAWVEAIAARRLRGTCEQPVSVAAVRLSVDQPVVSTRD